MDAENHIKLKAPALWYVKNSSKIVWLSNQFTKLCIMHKRQQQKSVQLCWRAKRILILDNRRFLIARLINLVSLSNSYSVTVARKSIGTLNVNGWYLFGNVFILMARKTRSPTLIRCSPNWRRGVLWNWSSWCIKRSPKRGKKMVSSLSVGRIIPKYIDTLRSDIIGIITRNDVDL